MKQLLVLSCMVLMGAKCSKPALVAVGNKPQSIDVADGPVTLCAFVIGADSTVAIGIDPRNADSVATKAMCAGTPLQQLYTKYPMLKK